jgi:rRNA maturation RNase YbeY
MKFICGDINIIFCSDEYLLEINRNYLKHDYYTDIITFNYNENTSLNGDLFISIDRVKDNSIITNFEFHTELSRVIIHGILHLGGHEDYSLELKNQIHQKEDLALERLSKNFL